MRDIDRGITSADVSLALPRSATDKAACLGGRPVTPAEEIKTGIILREELHTLQDPTANKRSKAYAIIAAAQQTQAHSGVRPR